MCYSDIVQTLFIALFVISGMLMLHFLFFAVVGIFCKKRYPKAKRINRYGIIIPARNEESVVAGLIQSVQKNRYPQDKLHIFVIAHNCTDRTAEVARSCGATVYEYNNPEECTMGYAFRHLFSCIERDYGVKSYDGFFLFNADNVLDIDYFSRMNDAFEYYDRKYVITSFRNSKNFGSNLISGLYGLYFVIGCRLESRGRTVCGCSTRVQGTGYVINSDVVKDGWPYVSLTEDWEFSANQILLGNKIRYCDDAVFYDEQPVSVPIMWRQRVRWSRGHLLVFYTRGKDLIRSVFSKESQHRGSLYDITMNILPSTLFWAVLYILQFIFLLTAPLIDHSVTHRELFLGSETDWLFGNGMLSVWLTGFLVSYALLFLSAVVVFIIERKRIKNVSLLRKLQIAFSWPLFLFIQFPIDIQAFFSKNLGWKPIPHQDQTSFDQVNDRVKEN